MMILSAVILLVSFIALAAMVARVNQLGTQTASDSEKAILDEVGPLSDIIDAGLLRLQGGGTRSVTATVTSGAKTLTTATSQFTANDVGATVSGGTGIPANTVIASYTSPTSVLLNNAATATSTASRTVAASGFGLSGQALENSVLAMLEQLQRLTSTRGLLLDYAIQCGGTTAAPTTAGSQAVVNLSDGEVHVQITSTVTFTRTSACPVGSLSPIPAALYPIA